MRRRGACDGCRRGSVGREDRRQTPEARRQAEAGAHAEPALLTPRLGALASELRENGFLSFQSHRFVVTSYNNPRK